MKQLYASRLRGFTLIELAIVVVLIGVMIAGVVEGLKLQRQSRLQEVLSEVERIKRAVATFKDKYYGYPGDLWNASEYIQGISAAEDGDGDGIIERTDSNSESLFLWRHLEGAGLIEGKFDGSGHLRNEGLMPSAIPQGSYQVYHQTVQASDLMLMAKLARTFDSNSSGAVQPSLNEADLSLLEPRDVYALDQQVDDGEPGSGMIRATEGSDASGVCVQSVTVYKLSDTDINCVMYFVLE